MILDPFRLRARGISDDRVLSAMARVPREAFVPDPYRAESLADAPLPIGFDQTISQPLVVAWMTQMLGVEPGVRLLEIGTGSGYQTAVLAELGAEVWSVEVVPGLAARARQTLASLGYSRLHLTAGNGSAGWPEAAPFARIILTAAPVEVPRALVDQLADAGRLVAPVGGDEAQVLVTLERHGEDVTRTESMAVRFVRMI